MLWLIIYVIHYIEHLFNSMGYPTHCVMHYTKYRSGPVRIGSHYSIGNLSCHINGIYGKIYPRH
jgi:hypothetical protein